MSGVDGTNLCGDGHVIAEAVPVPTAETLAVSNTTLPVTAHAEKTQ